MHAAEGGKLLLECSCEYDRLVCLLGKRNVQAFQKHMLSRQAVLHLCQAAGAHQLLSSLLACIGVHGNLTSHQCGGRNLNITAAARGNATLSAEAQVSPKEAEMQGEFDGRQWPVYVRLTNGKIYGADLVVSAIGVLSNTRWVPPEVELDEDLEGIIVDRCAWVTSPCACHHAARVLRA